MDRYIAYAVISGVTLAETAAHNDIESATAEALRKMKMLHVDDATLVFTNTRGKYIDATSVNLNLH